MSSNVTGNDCHWTATYTYSVKDACGNAAANAVVVFTGGDTQAPTFTRPADKIIPFTSTCGYGASVSNTGDVTNEADNCSTGLQATFTDVVSQCGNNTIIKRTWHLVDNCGNAATNQVQTITVTDNNTNYIIYATKEAMFGEDNFINGDVGVTDANGHAEFDEDDVLNPYKVVAKNITVHLPAQVNNKFYTPATGGPNPPFMTYNGTGGSGNYTATTNGTITGNYKNLTINSGVIATVTGNDFGKIRIRENAKVTFTGNFINLEELSVDGGENNGTTNVYFNTCTGVKVKNKVTIEENCRVNVGGPKVIFYMGDNNPDEKKFTVNGGNTQVMLNIMIPHGKLKVDGDEEENTNTVMTGWFIIEKLESGEDVSWNKYICSTAAAPISEGPYYVHKKPAVNEPPFVAPAPVAERFAVKVYPNPTDGDFNIRVNTNSNEPILVKIMDATGVVVESFANVTKSELMIPANKYRGGTYFVEVTQGKKRQVVKLTRLN